MNGGYATPAKRAHAWEREQTKIIFQYGLMTIASWVAGWLLPRFLGEGLWQSAENAIATHFALPFSAMTNAKELLYAVYAFFLPTLLCISIVGIFSFSSLNCLVSDGVLVYLGMRTGCTVSLLYSFFRSSTALSYRLDSLQWFLFILFKLLVLTVFFVYAVRMAKYSYRLRIYSQEGRTLFHPQTVGALLLQFALCTLVLFLLHLLYGCSIYLVSK